MTRQNKSDRSNTVRKRVLSRLTASCVGWMPCFQVLLTPPAPRPCVELTPIVTAANAQGFAVLLHTQPINQPVKHEQNNSGASKQEIKGWGSHHVRWCPEQPLCFSLLVTLLLFGVGCWWDAPSIETRPSPENKQMENEELAKQGDNNNKKAETKTAHEEIC